MRALPERALATTWVLVLAVAILVCGPVILAGELAARDSEDRFHRAAIAAAADTARGAAAEIDARIESVKRDLQRMSALELGGLIRAGDRQAVANRLIQQQIPGSTVPLSNEISNLWVTDGVGRHFVAKSGLGWFGPDTAIPQAPSPQAPDVGGSDFFARAARQVAALDTRPFVTRNVKFDPPFGSGPLVVAPIRDGLELAGVIVAQIKTGELARQLGAHIPSVDELVLFDDAGRLLARATDPLSTYIDLSSSSVVKTSLADRPVEGDADDPFGGGRRIVATATVGDTAWRVAAVSAASQAERDLADSLGQQRSVRFALVALLLFGTVVLARTVSEVARRRKALAESLERQTALSEILRAIAGSPGDQQPVLDAIARNTTLYCGAQDAVVLIVQGNEVAPLAHHGPIRTPRGNNPIVRTGVAGRAILERRTIHVADLAGPAGEEFPLARQRSEEGDRHRGILAAPLLREGTAIGAILLRKLEPTGFTPNEIKLVEAFADQAVIAIENVRLFNETKEALAQQTALSGVLSTISRSAFDLNAVLQTIVERAAELCRADGAAIFRRVGEDAIAAATFGDVGTAPGEAIPIDDVTVVGRSMLTGKRQYVPDARQHPDLPQDGPNTRLNIPFVRDGVAVGCLAVLRRVAKPFTESELRLFEVFADQAAIAIENVRLFNETREALERQTATREVLEVISRSSADIRPVLDSIATSAARYCRAQDVVVALAEGGQLVLRAHHGDVGTDLEAWPIDGTSLSGRSALERRTLHVADIQIEAARYPLGAESAARTGHRATLSVPLVRDAQTLGVLLLRRSTATPFTEREIDVSETFAEQAVIAIENVRLFNETKEALERQTSISEVLETIGRSAFDLQPVLDTVVERAARLCDADYGSISTLDGDVYRTKAYWGASTVPQDYIELMRTEARRPGRGTLIGRTVLEGRVIHIHDVLADPEYTASDMQQAGGYRTLLGVPLMRDGDVIGVFALCRNDVKPFTERQIDLVRTFGDQAAIAIENVRLFNETKESLERQTALAEILRVIADSPSDRQPVLDAVARSATRYCGAEDAVIFLVDGNELRRVAHHGPIPIRNETAPLDERGVAPHAVLTRRTIHVADIESPAGDRYPTTRAFAAESGRRGSLAAPLLREGIPIGVILLRKMEPTGFTPSQIQLVEAFADQAMIALENVRLFNETKEALEQQTAVSDVLKTISRSAFDLRPVLDIVLNNAVRLAGADIGWMARVENDQFSTVSYSTEFPQSVKEELFRRRTQGNVLGPWVPLGTAGGLMGFTLAEGRTVHLPDVKEDPELKDSVIVQMTSSRTVVGVPMLREGRSIGGMVLARYEVRPFSDRELELVQTFADQAAIAIENVRLFNETKEALERQTAIAQVLGEISQSGFDLRPVLETVIEHATELCAAQQGFIYRKQGDVFRLAVAHGITPEFKAFTDANPLNPMGRGTVTGRVVEDRKAVHIADVLNDPEYTYWEAQRLGNFRAILGVPMMRDDEVIGVMLLWRTEPQPFTEQEIALVTTFANQATIAIENVRLFDETRHALKQQTATAEVLKSISRATFDLPTVLQTLLERAVELCEADDGLLRQREGDKTRIMARTINTREPQPAVSSDLADAPIGSVTARVLETATTVHLADVLTDPVYANAPTGSALRPVGTTVRTLLGVPLLRERSPIGLMLLRRTGAPRPFTTDQIQLVETFADQAVIAIENVRLFNETKEALERQTATADVLRVIAASPTDVQPVLDSIADRAMRLCAADGMVIRLLDGGDLVVVARAGTLPAVGQDPRIPLTADTLTGTAVLEARTIHVADVQASNEYPRAREMALRGRHRTIAAVPLLREGRAIGVFSLARQQVRPYSDRELALVATFADQAVIAIQNVRLFNEIQNKSRQLEVASRHKSEFLANMSHELRTPLNAIIGFSEVLIQGLFGDVNEKQREYLQDVIGSGQHLLSLINDILDLSKIEAGRMELELSSFSLREALESGLTIVRERANRHNIAINAVVADDLGQLEADERKVKQIFFNLLSNAVKFTADGGRVDVVARRENGDARVEVRDSGIGIAEDDQARIFEEFQQVGRERSREGTGLGLTLTKRFVELHGGRIWLQSAPGKGSAFTFTLPLRQPGPVPA